MIKIFNMNDVEWWAGENGEECMEAMKDFVGYAEDEIEEMIGDGYPTELSDADLDRLTFVDTDTIDPESGECVKRSFREELKRIIDKGEEFPYPFASTEF